MRTTESPVQLSCCVSGRRTEIQNRVCIQHQRRQAGEQSLACDGMYEIGGVEGRRRAIEAPPNVSQVDRRSIVHLSQQPVRTDRQTNMLFAIKADFVEWR